MSSKNGSCLAFGDRMTGSVSIAFSSVVQRGKRYCLSQRDAEGYWRGEGGGGGEGKGSWAWLSCLGKVQAHKQLLLSDSQHEGSCPVLFPLGAPGFSSRPIFSTFILSLSTIAFPAPSIHP